MRYKMLIVALLITLCGCVALDKPPVATVLRDADGKAISTTAKDMQEKPPDGYAQKPTIFSTAVDSGYWLLNSIADGLWYIGGSLGFGK